MCQLEIFYTVCCNKNERPLSDFHEEHCLAFRTPEEERCLASRTPEEERCLVSRTPEDGAMVRPRLLFQNVKKP